jgi:acyl-CoA thioesterase I
MQAHPLPVTPGSIRMQAHPIQPAGGRPARRLRTPASAPLMAIVLLVGLLAATGGAAGVVGATRPAPSSATPGSAAQVAALTATPAGTASPVPQTAADAASPLADLTELTERIAAAAAGVAVEPGPVDLVAVTPKPTPKSTSAPARSAQVKAAVGSGLSSRVAVFLGDSYTSGYAGFGYGSDGWPAIVSKAMGWKKVNLAVPGTGFVNPGWTNQPVGSRVSAAIAAHPGVVILAAGHNDSHWSTAAINAAADAVINRLRSALPNARLIIVGPIWSNGYAPQRALLLRDHLRAKAAAVDAIFIDPIGGGWFAGSYSSLIGPDNLHPTNAGHRRIAALVIARLNAL